MAAIRSELGFSGQSEPTPPQPGALSWKSPDDLIPELLPRAARCARAHTPKLCKTQARIPKPMEAQRIGVEISAIARRPAAVKTLELFEPALETSGHAALQELYSLLLSFRRCAAVHLDL